MSKITRNQLPPALIIEFHELDITGNWTFTSYWSLKHHAIGPLAWPRSEHSGPGGDFSEIEKPFCGALNVPWFYHLHGGITSNNNWTTLSFKQRRLSNSFQQHHEFLSGHHPSTGLAHCCLTSVSEIGLPNCRKNSDLGVLLKWVGLFSFCHNRLVENKASIY